MLHGAQVLHGAGAAWRARRIQHLLAPGCERVGHVRDLLADSGDGHAERGGERHYGQHSGGAAALDAAVESAD